MRLLVGLILTALYGLVGTESRGVAGFANFDIAPPYSAHNLLLVKEGSKYNGGNTQF